MNHTVVVADNPDASSDVWFYALMVIYLSLAFAYFAVDAAYAENKFQLVAAILVSAFSTTFVVFKCAHESSTQSSRLLPRLFHSETGLLDSGNVVCVCANAKLPLFYERKAPPVL
eukprot:SAG11_NODE_524_length_8751_cov_4.292765_13_plen_115_part_00